ncbi:hypothetical protein Rhe02_93580 [Rhizocola hellebori]|uniref:Uncharacterized protein n=1 Tax=Rhizocola hellebori TaxID=1392758 RepID=A0A8J3VMI9_9ACTN|nr:hypothetical protein [Rhizocola hellebori]GIH11291.1 hypothetical protein Rhe02_93580 [Rhizocola hellebori]
MSHPHGESSEPATAVDVPHETLSISAPATPPGFTPAPAPSSAPAQEPVAVAAEPVTQAYVPVAAMPQQVAPVSAPGYAPGYAPVSAVPGYGPVSAVPYGIPGYPMEAPKKKGRAGIIVLSILTGLLTLGAAGMTTLYFVEKSERTAADKKVTEQAATITTEQAKVKDLEGKWSQTKSEVAKLTQEVEGAKSKTADVTKEKEALAACFRAMDDYFLTQNKANQLALQTACDEASKYY